MAAGPAPKDRPLLDKDTFKDNFSEKRICKTYLCYEVEAIEDDSWIPVDVLKGFVQNKGANTGESRHAELFFLERTTSWNLSKEKHYRVTCYISWSPCRDCALELTEFLSENSHVSLRVFFARIYTFLRGYEDGLRTLNAAGAQIAAMTSMELKHCWENFVDHEGEPFEPWANIDENSQSLSETLENILNEN